MAAAMRIRHPLASALVPVLLLSGGLVAGTAPAPAAAAADAAEPAAPETDRPVPVTPVRPGGAAFTDPAADQVWRADAVAAALPEPATAVFHPGRGALAPAGVDAPAGFPVSVTPAGYGPYAAPAGPVRVEILDAGTAAAAGVDGLLLTVSGSGTVNLAVDYSRFAGRYGGGWGGRLRLLELPPCAVSTPEVSGCLETAPVDSTNWMGSRTVSARVPLTGAPGPRVFALTAGPGSGAVGDFGATDLSRTGSWTAGGSDGAFGYGYPLRTPPAAGPVPALTLGYSSAVHDGRTSGSNNQASWIGDGWSYEPGFVERSYRPCATDDAGDSNSPELTGDLCWDGDGASITLALNGTSTALVRDDGTGAWRAAADPNWRIEKLGAPAAPGSATTERWRVTTPDGTRYEFAAAAEESGSRLTVPVFGNHPGEPCRAADFAGSSCRQAYRWLLDSVVDPHGNLARYHYAAETGHYGAAGDPDRRVSYHRSSRPVRIEYGLRTDSGVAATGRVLFTAADRCLSGCGSAADPTTENWPDTPWDLECDAAPCTTQLAPSFFATTRLAAVTTQVRDGSGFRDVDSWALAHEFKDYGDADQAVLWLRSIRQTGHVGGSAALPPVEFGGEALPNRVDAAAGVPVMWRWRMSSIKTETGAVLTVTYSAPECAPGDLPGAAHTNAMRCYPVRWTPEFFGEPIEDWFHKYVVASVVETDTTGGSPAVETYYDYATTGGGTSVLWAWDESEFTEDEHRTYNVWRGYAQVTTRVGDPAQPQARTRTRFYRGLDGQPLPSGGERSVSLTDAEGNTVTDHEALAGLTYESVTYDGDTVVRGGTTGYWTRKTATRQRDHDGGDLEAWLSGPSVERTRTRLTGSAWQRTETRTTYDGQGRPVRVDDLGDAGRTGDETCTRNQYVADGAGWIRQAVARTEIVTVDCDATPARPDDVAFDQRSFFDGSGTLGAAPTRGLPTRTDVLDEWDGGPVYVTTSRMTYDALGRVTVTTDAAGHTTTTAHTPAGPGPLVRKAQTNPLGHTTTVHFEPAWGEKTAIIDPNGRRTDIAHDALGRAVEVWTPGRDRATRTPSARYEYLVRDDAPSAVRTRTLNHREEYVTGVELYDSLLRRRQTQADAAGGGRILGEVRYDGQGRVDEEVGPDHNTDPPSTGIVRVGDGESARRVEYRYDGAGRTVAEIVHRRHEELWRTTTSYGGSAAGFQVAVQPPEGAPGTATIADARGNIVEKRTFHSNLPTGGSDTLRYTYDGQNRMTGMTDAAGNAWKWEYDLRGHLVAAHDPDSGTTERTYDDMGRLASVTDARGATVVNSYDALGRQVSRRDGAGTLLAEWEYDTAVGGIGMVGRSVRWHDGQAYAREIRAVNGMGLVTQAAVTLPASAGPLAGRHFFTQSYHPNGQVAAQGLPGVGGLERGTLSWAYDRVGNPTRMVYQGQFTGVTVIVDEATFTPFNEILTRRLGAGNARHAYHGFVYEEGTRRLRRATFDREASLHSVADLRYTYDDAGNVLSIADVPEDLPANHELQCFRYDHLRRLVEAWAQGGTDGCAATPATAVLGGPAPYWNSYRHDVAGNRTGETLRTPAATRSRGYAYPEAGADRPHALLRVTSTGPEPPSEFTYDGAGNTVRRAVDGLEQVLTWDVEGTLGAVEDAAGTVQMIYDADGGRLVRDDGDTVTAYLPQTELSWDRGTGAVTGTRYFSHAGQVVAVCTGRDPADWTFMGIDHHGTTTTHSVNAFSGVEQVRRMDPYGNSRGAPPATWPGQRGFAGGVHDPTGLVQVGARQYDPAFGRFVSVDPILDTSDDQQINGYAYAHNNPVTFTDPTGLFPSVCLEECGSEADRWYQDYVREQQAAAGDRPPAAPPSPERGANNTPGFEPVYVGHVQFVVPDPERPHIYYEVSATAYIWCNDDLTECDYYWNSQTMQYEVYVELIVATVEEFMTGLGPHGRDGGLHYRLLYSDCTIHGRLAEPGDDGLAFDVGRAMNVLDASLDASGAVADYADVEYPMLRERPEPALKTLDKIKFFPLAGFAVDTIVAEQEGDTWPGAVATGAGATAGGLAGGWLGTVGGAALASLICGPGAPVCAAAIVGLSAAVGGYLGSEAGGDVGTGVGNDLGW
jgi:RHS repeat-associated protein